jgi:hypothetical protein
MMAPTKDATSTDSSTHIRLHPTQIKVIEFWPCRGDGAFELQAEPWALLDIGYERPVLLDGMDDIIAVLDACYPNDPTWWECEGAIINEMIHGEVPWIYDFRALIEEGDASVVCFELRDKKRNILSPHAALLKSVN